jgi:hypothetical protein
LGGAGAYQIKSSTAKLEWYGTYFDDPTDQYWIKEGYNDRPGNWTDRGVLVVSDTIDSVVNTVSSWF